MRLSDRYLDVASALSGLITWLLVLGVPVEVGLAVERGRPRWPALVDWACGLATFGLCLTLAELFWRGLRHLLTAGQAGRQHPQLKTLEMRAADLIALVIEHENIRWSRIERSWPTSVENPLAAEAYAILRDCTEATRDRLDQAKLNQQLQLLNDIMNRLRTQ